MRYQALVLLLIVLVSSYLFRDSTVFSQSGNGASQAATAIDTINLESSPKVVQNNEGVINKTDSSSENVSAPTTSSPSAQIAPAEPAPVESRVENAIVEKPIIEEAASATNQLCSPVDSQIFIAQTIDGANIIYEKNSQNRWPIASVTKLMTAVVALENLNQSDIVQITQQNIDDTKGNNSFNVGDSFTVDGTVKALLMLSSNDAAYALTNNIGTDAFVQKMNDKAKEISMSQTSFYEPSGLSYLNQSTAHDLYLLLIYIQKHDPLILNITTIKSMKIRNQTKGAGYKTLTNINEFAGRSDFFGGKTGYIDQSGGNLVSLFRKNGKMIYIGVFGSSDRFVDTQTILSCIQ